MSLIGIVKSGDVIGAVKKIWALVFGGDLPDELASLVAKFATDEGKIVWTAATTALGELSSKGLKQAAADAWAIIATQTPTMALQDLEDALGIQSRATTA